MQNRWSVDCIIGIFDKLPEANTPLSFDGLLGIRLPKTRVESQKPLLHRANPENLMFPDG
jgi:hypothetical protein